MRQVLIAALALLALVAMVYGTRRVFYHLSSPEDQIRERLESMAEGFNGAWMSGVLDGFADEYRDEGSGTDRGRVRDILLYLFFQELDAQGGFALSVELPPEELEIEIDRKAPERAQVGLRAIFRERRGDEERLYWDAHVQAELVDRGDEWEILRTFEVNHGDRRVRR